VREDELLAALHAIVADRAPRRILLGIGDDAAVWQPSRSHRSVITTDALIEGVHFVPAWMSWCEVGMRAMASNLSDIAAMGAKPVLATVALGIPQDFDRDGVLDLYRGLAGVARDGRCAIVGGDITRAPVVTIAITVVGEVRQTHVKRRSGARAGDAICVTGDLGASRAGLQCLRGEVALEDAALRERALAAYRTPTARWREGLWLGASANVNAMMDCSDGLSTDLDRLCIASGVGALVENVPVAEAAAAAARALGISPEDYALAGGEDFELVLAVKPRAYAHLAARFRARFGRPLHRIGTFRAQPGLASRVDGSERPLHRTGWDALEE
jgi:thiamine-monophosphate kinase